MLTEEQLALLRQMARGIAAQFGPSCEVVVHDLAPENLEHTVVHIENGQVSGRKLGDGPSHAVLDVLREQDLPPEDRLAYLTRTPSGKILKSSSLYIRDPSGRPQAVFSINYDISPLLTIETALKGLTASGQPSAQEQIGRAHV